MYLFFFNGTATTHINTDGHTLSLPDALPVWRRGRDGATAGPRRQGAGGAHRRRRFALRPRRRAADRRRRRGARHRCRAVPQGGRAEEPRSAPQPLIPSSYAVLSFEKKTHIHISYDVFYVKTITTEEHN